MKSGKQRAISLTRREAFHLGLGSLVSTAVAATGTRAAEAGAVEQERMAIDRQAVVTRHNIRVTSSSDLQVGNGEFAITTDLSGLISFSNNPLLAHWGCIPIHFRPDRPSMIFNGPFTGVMTAAGWDGCPEGNAPGFPDDGSWSVKWEGLKPALGLDD